MNYEIQYGTAIMYKHPPNADLMKLKHVIEVTFLKKKKKKQ
jgi:hypothetical protein